MVRRIYVEKKPAHSHQSKNLLKELKTQLKIEELQDLRVINRYDVENISKPLFQETITAVFSEPPLDKACSSFVELGVPNNACVFAVEKLPGQFDQRADSAAQCIQLISQKEKPIVRYAKIYVLYGNLSQEQIKAIKKYLINPVESREAQLTLPKSLMLDLDEPKDVEILTNFNEMDCDDALKFIQTFKLAMDMEDLKACQQYFIKEGRYPTITEIKLIDTYWSDHCRHTTFNTIIDEVTFEDPLIESAYTDYLQRRNKLEITKPVTLMDIATIAVKHLKAQGKLENLDQSKEINACTIKVNITVNSKEEKWLLLFKNETHNHPTEIEPFGGAATCLGGCIRDPLSGRGYVYAAMRISGGSNPLAPVEESLLGKLPQRTIAQEAAKGYSSYGNQIGLATGIVDEIYHPGFLAKRMEVGAVIAAAPVENVVRQEPEVSDVIVLLGGATGRDGIGGATGSSKAQNSCSVETCGAQVQKGNPPEERKMQRLFKNKKATRLIKRCNDFGAGGVAVAIGELADGININLDAIPKKYEGLDGTDLALSESQERMACVIAEKDVRKFIQLAAKENLNCTVVATITDDNYLTMTWRNKRIVHISRVFLDSNGPAKHTKVNVKKHSSWKKKIEGGFQLNYMKLMGSLNCCSKKGLSECFDSTIGAATLLMPFGGKYQQSPIQAMVHKLPVNNGCTDHCSFMSWGYNPYICEKSPYHGAYLAVIESISKLIATGSTFNEVYLSFQEYFQALDKDPSKWGKPFAALLGAYKAQIDLGVAAIGGKDSMSGTFENIHVPPTLISFAVSTGLANHVISPEFKHINSKVILLEPQLDNHELPIGQSQVQLFNLISLMARKGIITSAYTPSIGGIAEAIFKMSIGNELGFSYEPWLSVGEMFAYKYGSFIIELAPGLDVTHIINFCKENGFNNLIAKGSVNHKKSGSLTKLEKTPFNNLDANKSFGDVNEKSSFTKSAIYIAPLGTITNEGALNHMGDTIQLEPLLSAYENKLEPVYPRKVNGAACHTENLSFTACHWPSPTVKNLRPKVVIPVFPGTNCEIDSAKAFEAAGAKPEILVIKNLTSDDIKRSITSFSKSLATAQILFIPGGFSGGDEPEGSAKFIAAFLRNLEVQEGLARLIDKEEGLVAGICNGFQALIKVGLLPYGKITDLDNDSPTLTVNTIGCHQSRIIRTRIASNKSPWLSSCKVGDIFLAPISHGEGRFIANSDEIMSLAKNGQIATQYADMDNNASCEIDFNPNNSMYSVEGITSPDGRIFGKMAHSERTGSGLYKNVQGNYNINMFKNAVRYFR